MRQLKWIVPLCVALALTACASMKNARAEDKEKEEGNEVKVKIADVPEAVRKTLARESDNAKIDEVDKETDEGKTIYEADVKMNNHNYEIKVATDGTLISKKLDEGDEKGEGKEGKEGKGKEKEEDEKNEK
jgi:hypothetical protein